MGIPKGISVVETMIGTRAGKVAKLNYTNLTGVKDSEAQGFNFPAQYMFKDVPWSNQARNFEEESEPPEGADLLLPYMEKHNIEIAMIGVGPGEERSRAREAIDNYPDRFIGCHEPDPNNVMTISTVLKERLGFTKPANTTVCAPLAVPGAHVEIEVDAIWGSGTPREV